MKLRIKNQIFGLILIIILFLGMISTKKNIDGDFINTYIYFSMVIGIAMEVLFASFLKFFNAKSIWLFNMKIVRLMLIFIILNTIFLTYIVLVGGNTNVYLMYTAMNSAVLLYYINTIIYITPEYIFYKSKEIRILEIKEFQFERRSIIIKSRNEITKIRGTKKQLVTLSDIYNLLTE